MTKQLDLYERWLPVAGYEGRYEVSSHGRVRSLLTDRILKRRARGYCYWGVGLCNGKERKFYIHRLVAIAFIPNPEGHPEVMHKDENPDNCAADNLMWGTRAMNLGHRDGTYTPPSINIDDFLDS